MVSSPTAAQNYCTDRLSRTIRLQFLSNMFRRSGGLVMTTVLLPLSIDSFDDVN